MLSKLSLYRLEYEKVGCVDGHTSDKCDAYAPI
jgi:hypothetical protein